MTRHGYRQINPDGEIVWVMGAMDLTLSFISLGSGAIAKEPASGGCIYTPGDFNGISGFNGIDVVAFLNYLKGWPVPGSTVRCPECQALGLNMLYPSGDVNGSCSVNGMDVSCMVNYFKFGAQFPPTPCPRCPPAR